ncbi:MAG: carboxypeptidase-like regulatory domain-containing protein [Bacteroidetes bacterium]|nr:carboxypeptidase-like regulatory domain-containing protein [Bacteroidota bacterium]
MRLTIFLALSFLIINLSFSQTGRFSGRITHEGEPIEFAKIGLKGTSLGAVSDLSGSFEIKEIPFGTYEVVVSIIGFQTQKREMIIGPNQLSHQFDFVLQESNYSMNEVVISGTMKEVNKLDSPVPVEVYSAEFFEANPTPSIFESMQNVNGVRPQLNCNVCNTGDIHINGLEGPYTMILIDGMPIVSGLSTVYGLTGIPQSLVERVEIVKGPASTFYGSEAVGGLINIITKKPVNAPLVSADVFATSWQEVNTDLGLKFKAGSKAH